MRTPEGGEVSLELSSLLIKHQVCHHMEFCSFGFAIGLQRDLFSVPFVNSHIFLRTFAPT